MSVKLPGSDAAESLRLTRNDIECVGDIKDAVVSRFKKRFASVDPDEVQLLKLDGSTRTLLGPTQTLNEAGVFAGTKLAVEVTPFVDPHSKGACLSSACCRGDGQSML